MENTLTLTRQPANNSKAAKIANRFEIAFDWYIKLTDGQPTKTDFEIKQLQKLELVLAILGVQAWQTRKPDAPVHKDAVSLIKHDAMQAGGRGADMKTYLDQIRIELDKGNLLHLQSPHYSEFAV